MTFHTEETVIHKYLSLNKSFSILILLSVKNAQLGGYNL